MAAPTPQSWTLRFKSHKSTIVLHVDPLHTFSTIKSFLFDALTETGLRDPDTGEPLPLPSSPSDIQLGRPANINVPTEGFQLGEWEYASATDDEDEAPKAKGKGKAKAGPKSNGTAKASAANVKDCPKGAGLKDGGVLAFRWRGDGVWSGDEEEEVQEGDMWGVVLASYEDVYGVMNEMDVGGGQEFEG